MLACEGPVLTVYELRGERRKLFKKALFPSCFKITDVTVHEDLGVVLIHTEKSLKVLDSDTYELRFDFPKQSVDKIIHASLQPINDKQDQL